MRKTPSSKLRGLSFKENGGFPCLRVSSIFSFYIFFKYLNAGRIEESLSSPRYSYVRGLGETVGMCNQPIIFDVHTHDIKGRPSRNHMDDIQVRENLF